MELKIDSIKRKHIIFQFALAGVLILLLVGSGSYYLMHSSMDTKEQILEKQKDDVGSSVGLLAPLVSGTIEEASSLLFLCESGESLEDAVALMKKHAIAKPWLGNIIIKDRNATVVYEYESDSVKSTQSLKRADGHSGLKVFPSPHSISGFNPYDLVLSLPLYSEDREFLGEAMLSIKYSFLENQLISHLNEDLEALLFVAFDDGVISLAYSDYSHRTDMIGELLYSLEGFDTPLLEEDFRSGEYWLKDGESRYFIQTLSSLPASIVAKVDRAKAIKEWEEGSFYPTLIAIGLVSTLSFVALVFLVLRAKQTVLFVEELNRRVEVSREEIEQKNTIIYEQSKTRALNDLLVDLAHQWRQPLNSASLIIQSIEDEIEDSPNRDKIVAYINEATSELKSLSETITKISGYYEDSSNIKTNGVVGLKKVLDLTMQTLKFKSIDVDMEIESEPKILARLSEWIDIFTTMFANVSDIIKIKSLEGAKIKVTFSDSEDSEVITIKDDAGGIDSSLLPKKIFDPYVTTHFRSRDKGLGLYTVKSIIKNRLDGDISALNSGDGAVFIIHLPKSRREGE